ncbi:2812_t:CDS:2, partial [Funneliformis mosseae]
DFEYNYLNEEDDITNLDDDNLSSTTSNINSYTTESTSYNEEILPFTLDEIEIDSEIVINTKVENKLYTLGVCMSHYSFDQNSLHNPKLKQQRSVEKSWIYKDGVYF